MLQKSTKIPPPAFESASFASAPNFPALRFTSQAEFQDYLGDSQSLLDAREAYEQSLGLREGDIVQPGTCAPCLRAACFTSAASGGVRLPDGRCVPNWREAMHCDCRERLNNRQRALLHFSLAAGLLPWTQLLLLGEPSALGLRLSGIAGAAARLGEGADPPGAAAFQLAVAETNLHRAMAPAMLEEVSRRLVGGGRFIFTASFAPLMSASAEAETLPFGWDLLALLHQAGFSDAAAYLYWSEELGYLGPMNFIFRAVK